MCCGGNDGCFVVSARNKAVLCEPICPLGTVYLSKPGWTVGSRKWPLTSDHVTLRPGILLPCGEHVQASWMLSRGYGEVLCWERFLKSCYVWTNLLSQIAKSLGSISTGHWSDLKVPDPCPIDINLRVFAIWGEHFIIYHNNLVWRLLSNRNLHHQPLAYWWQDCLTPIVDCLDTKPSIYLFVHGCYYSLLYLWWQMWYGLSVVVSVSTCVHTVSVSCTTAVSSCVHTMSVSCRLAVSASIHYMSVGSPTPEYVFHFPSCSFLNISTSLANLPHVGWPRVRDELHPIAVGHAVGHAALSYCYQTKQTW